MQRRSFHFSGIVGAIVGAAIAAVVAVAGSAGCAGRSPSLSPSLVDDPDGGVADGGADGLTDDVIDEPDAPAVIASVPFLGGSGLDDIHGATVLQGDGGGAVVVLAGRFENTGDVVVGEGAHARAVVVPGNRESFGFIAGFDVEGRPLWSIVVDGSVQILEDGVIEVSGTWDLGGPDERRMGDGSTGGFIGQVGPDGRLRFGHELPVDMFVTHAAVVGERLTVVGFFARGEARVAMVDVTSGELLWRREAGLWVGPVGLAGMDKAGRPYLLLNTDGAVTLDGATLLPDVEGDPIRPVIVAFDDRGRVRWTREFPAPAGGSAELLSLVEGPDGLLVAAGTVSRTAPIFDVSAEDLRQQANAAWIVRLRPDDGSLVDEQLHPGPEVISDLVSAGGRTWARSTMLDASAASWGDGRVHTALLGGMDDLLVELDRQGRPRRALPLFGDGDDKLARLGGRDDVVIAYQPHAFTYRSPLWVARDGARVELPAGDARALVLRARDDEDARPAALGKHATSPLLRTIGGSGFDAGKDVALLTGGAVFASGRFTPTGDVTASGPGGEMFLDGPPGWTMGYVIRFDTDGAPRWAVTAGAPFGIGGTFPIAAMAVSDDGFSLFIAGNVGAGGGAFDAGNAGGIPFDGGFVARLDGTDGSLVWLEPLEPFVEVESLALTSSGLAIAWRAPEPAVALLDEADGSLRWVRGIEGAHRGSAVVGDGDRIFYLSQARGSVGVHGGTSTAFADEARAVALAFSRDGRHLWTHTHGKPARSLAFTAGVAFGGRLLACGSSRPADSTLEGTLDGSVDGSVDVGESHLAFLRGDNGELIETMDFAPRGCAGVALDEAAGALVVADHGTDVRPAVYGEVGWDRRGFSDIVIAALDLDGAPVRATAVGGRGFEKPEGIAARNGRVAVTGRFLDALTLDDGTRVRPVRGDALVVLSAPP